ncbi:nitrilase-related carbon-nitrogen hydrolase [Ruminococcus sp.]|uniref:nitrilase-related carbon-nitrogen hydrolase n=1 Tax=Ruminococcus sp. TaxID=41978 RepID=UPI002632643B|nr:nitrilase-related carbon-nitrogen hydrolase [Ruminococcus sp.]MDD6988551.1 dockerin type I domain-containing protein [Ruminococcus sp.]MDY6200922.1 nitrilase-related carbon-nitrogen hydrolase [Ruminococcus sp.]
MKRARKLSKKIVSAAVASTIIMTASVTAFATDYTRLDRISQPKVSHTFAKDELGVVNFKSTWGDKEANVSSMLNYVEQAHEKGVKILLFPEMCVTGYVSSSDPESLAYQTAVNLAETSDGPTATTFAEVADTYDMWIIYGATETIEGDSEHAYNSAFICSPEGEVTTYQKISPVEGSWCTPGENPVLIDAGDYGLIGVSICYDTYAMPEIGRYYAAKGCNILLNPTATSRSYTDTDGDGVKEDTGWEWYYKNRIESNTSRDGYTLLSSNLVGADGPVKSDGKQAYDFPGGSVILQSGTKYYAGTTDETVFSNTEADIITGEEGLLTNKESLKASTGSTCTNQDFRPEDYAKWYDELADMQDSGDKLSYSNNVTDGPVAAVVNMPGVWGDKQANIDAMEKYIIEAGEKGVDILVFPETVLTGYEWKKPENDPYYQESGVAMQVALAETIPGPTTNYFSQYAQQYGMYIIFGMTEKEDEPIYDMTDGGTEKVYNSAAILYPDGTIDSYQKMHRAGNESKWSVCGDTPYMFETQWGKIGIDICRDGHFYPELGRYYAAMGCTMLIHPTATTGNPWYRETRIGSYTDRDGMAAITCNLLGPDGTYDESTEKWSGGVFASTSLIITKYHNASGRTSFDPETGYAIDLNGTGSASEGFDERGTSPEGLEIAKMNLSGCGFRLTNFQARLYSKMYDELAVLYRDGYTSIYDKAGDANGDTEVNIEDVTYIQKAGLGMVESNDKCDLNGDGRVSILDVTLLQKYLAGYNVTLK